MYKAVVFLNPLPFPIITQTSILPPSKFQKYELPPLVLFLLLLPTFSILQSRLHSIENSRSLRTAPSKDPNMPPRSNFTPNQRHIDEVIHDPRRPSPASPSDSTSSYNCNTPSDSSSSEGLGAVTTTRSRESASDSDSDPPSSLTRRVNQMGGLGAAAAEMFSSRESRVAERAARRAEEDRIDELRRRGGEVWQFLWCLFIHRIIITAI